MMKPASSAPSRFKRVYRFSFFQQILLLVLSMALGIGMWLFIRHAHLQAFRTSYRWAHSYKQLAILTKNVSMTQKIARIRLHLDQRTTLLGEIKRDYDSFYQYFLESNRLEKSRYPSVVTEEATQHILEWIKATKAFIDACDGVNSANILDLAARVKTAHPPCEQALLAISHQYSNLMKTAAETRFDVTGMSLLICLALLAIGQLLLLRSEYLKQSASMRLAEELGRIINDIRVPQQVASSAVSMVLLPSSNSAMPRDMIQTAADSLSAMQRLLDSALLRISAGPKPEAIRLPDFLRDICIFHEVSSKEKGLEWKFYLAPSAEASVLVDHSAVVQILNNLLSNAVRYTEKGAISLNVQLDEPRLSRSLLFSKSGRRHILVLTVTDTGCGIPKDSMALIFKKFQPAHWGAGFGIGLFTVSRLINDLRGRIDVWSEIGRGTRFVVSIPVSKISDLRCSI